MADETQITRTPRPAPAPDVAALPRRPAPEDPDAARAEIEATRARMSGTIDEIEDALLRRKEDLREKLDVLAPVREEPLKTIGMIFGAAILLGLLTGGGKKARRHLTDEDLLALRDSGRGGLEPDEDDEDDDEAEEEAALAWQRAEEWEDRAHRLLRIARVQENELEIHREREEKMRRQLRARPRYVVEDEDDDEADGEPNIFQRLRDTATDRIAELAGEVSNRMMRGG